MLTVNGEDAQVLNETSDIIVKGDWGHQNYHEDNDYDNDYPNGKHRIIGKSKP